MCPDQSSGLRKDVNGLINNFGTNCCIKYFNSVLETGSYDCIESLSQSGNDLWFSGLPQPITLKSPVEARYLEQGLVREGDQKFYCNAKTVNASGMFRVMVGSSTTGDYYKVLDKLGVHTQKVSNEGVYHKMYIRKLTLGSLYGEPSV